MQSHCHIHKRLTFGKEQIDILAFLLCVGYLTAKDFSCIQGVSRGLFGLITLFSSKADSHINIASWGVFLETMESKSNHPAMIYKLNDIQIGNIKTCWDDFSWWFEFKKQENVDIHQRRYRPPLSGHSWPVNEAWTWANILRRRPFHVYSSLDEYNFQRRENANKPSAFAKEITMAYKAGYRFSENPAQLEYFFGLPFYCLKMQPTLPLPTHLNLKLNQLSPTNQECKHMMKKMKAMGLIKPEVFPDMKAIENNRYRIFSFKTQEKILQRFYLEKLVSGNEIISANLLKQTVGVLLAHKNGLKTLKEKLLTFGEMEKMLPDNKENLVKLLDDEGLKLLQSPERDEILKCAQEKGEYFRALYF